MCGSSTENVMACSYTCFLGISNCSEVVNDCGMIGNTCGIDSITTHASPEETTAGSYTVLYGGIVLLAVFIMSVVFVCIRKSLGRCRKDDTGLSSRRHSDSVHEVYQKMIPICKRSCYSVLIVLFIVLYIDTTAFIL